MDVAREDEGLPEARDLRRGSRVDTCCRAVVHDAHGAWTAIAEDLGARGCRLVGSRAPRVGTMLAVTLASDLFEAELGAVAEVRWVRHGRAGVMFAAEDGPAAAAWYVLLSAVDELGARIRLASLAERFPHPRLAAVSSAHLP